MTRAIMFNNRLVIAAPLLAITLQSAYSPHTSRDVASLHTPRRDIVAEQQQPLERAEYQVKLGSLDAGTGEMTVTGHDT
ncbi:MAG TPA: hypothetical protein VF461_21800, partial [Gemmatimonadaceae bacterium]